jgi:hypothetical protein
VSPVMYVPLGGRPSLLHFYDPKPDTPLPTRGISSQVAFDRFWQYLNKFHKRVEAGDDSELATVWRRVVEFLDLSVLSYLKFYDYRLHDEHEDNYYMEREWRASKSIQFELNDIQRIIIPTTAAESYAGHSPNTMARYSSPTDSAQNIQNASTDERTEVAAAQAPGGRVWAVS